MYKPLCGNAAAGHQEAAGQAHLCTRACVKEASQKVTHVTLSCVRKEVTLGLPGAAGEDIDLDACK